jgi:hypothetical protein
MPRISLGVLCGLIFGSLDTALMIPLSFPDKRAAMLGAFIARFALGFVICNIKTPVAGMGHRIVPRRPVKPPGRYHHESYGPNSRVRCGWRAGYRLDCW